MQGIKLGRLIRQNRIRKRISEKQLSQGLCSQAALVQYEKGKRIPDSLLFQRFLQRMGISSENFVFMLSEEEYRYYRWKEQIRAALERQDWEQLEDLLKMEEALCPKCNERIQKQYFFFLKGIVQMKRFGDGKKAAASLRTAAEQTVPDFVCGQESELLLGVDEIHILILYLYYGMKEKILDAEEGRRLFVWLERIIDSVFWEDDEKVKMYPKLVCAWIGAGKDQISASEKIRLCGRAAEFLRKTHQLYDITEVLRLYAEALKQEKREYRFWETHYRNFCDIFQAGGQDSGFHPECSWARVPKGYLLSEYLRAKRKKMELTQREASEGICEPENYSRLEQGHRMPSVRHYYALADRLEIPWGYCRGELDTDDCEILRMRTEERKLGQKGEWEAALKILAKMEQKLDMGEAANYQYIRRRQYVMEYYLGHKKAEEAYQKLSELLNLTIPSNLEESKLYCYSQHEIELITQMAQILGDMGKSKEGIELLEKTLAIIKNSKVDAEFQWNGIDFLLRELGRLYFDETRYLEALELNRYVFKITVRHMEAGCLYELLDAIADDLEHLGERYSEEYKMLYRQTYYTADFIRNNKANAFIKQYYEENFDDKIQWYNY